MSIEGLSGLSSVNIGKSNIESLKNEGDVSSFQKMLDDAVSTKDDKKLLESCQMFEGYFLQHMYKEMQKTVDDKNSLIPKSQATNIFTDFLVEEYAKNTASTGAFGLTDMMYKSMKAQEIAKADPINKKES